MKLYINVLTFFLLGNLLVKTNDPINLLYNYQIKSGDAIINEECILIVDGNNSIFKSYGSILNRRTLEQQLQFKSVKSTSLKKSKVNFSIEKKGDDYAHYELVAGAKLYYKSNSDAYKWEIKDEIIVKNGKKLTKAKTKYGGRNWVAWFDLATSVANGPYIFGGLPGLIIEIYDTDSIHHFIFKGMLEEKIEKKHYEIEKKNTYQKVTYQKLIVYREDAMKNYYENYNNNSRLKLPEVSANKKKEFNKRKKENFVPIELINE